MGVIFFVGSVTNYWFLVYEKSGQNKVRCGFINFNGRTIIPFKYGNSNNFDKGLAIVSMNGMYGVIDENDKVIIPFKYKFISPFDEGWAVVQNSDDKYGIINKAGEVLILADVKEKINNK